MYQRKGRNQIVAFGARRGWSRVGVGAVYATPGLDAGRSSDLAPGACSSVHESLRNSLQELVPMLLEEWPLTVPGLGHDDVVVQIDLQCRS